MADLAFLPRTFLARTGHGTAFYFDRRRGLLAVDEASGRWRSITADELRRGFPGAWGVWLRFAAFLPHNWRTGIDQAGAVGEPSDAA